MTAIFKQTFYRLLLEVDSILTKGFPILVRRRIYIESGPNFYLDAMFYWEIRIEGKQLVAGNPSLRFNQN